MSMTMAAREGGSGKGWEGGSEGGMEGGYHEGLRVGMWRSFIAGDAPFPLLVDVLHRVILRVSSASHVIFLLSCMHQSTK